MIWQLLLGVVIAVVQGCDKSAPQPSKTPVISTPTPTPDQYFTTNYNIVSLGFTTDFEPAKKLGMVENSSLNEISGIASGKGLPNTLWSEEDSGNENNLYLMKTTGEHLGTIRMTSITNRDWEDMSIAPGPVNSESYIYLAEIGDNKRVNADKYIFRFQEPTFVSTTFPFTIDLPVVDKITFSYPDGNKNAEAVMIDPATKDIYIVSKENQAVIYVARYPQDIAKSFVMTKLGVLPISDVTSADISVDGNEIVIKNYALILYWKKSGNESITQLLHKEPLRAPYQIEEKGEAICWAADGSGYYTTSELPSQPIYFYKRKN
ncbi:hypothetical protein BH10BAC4_BH10BAC4_03030 [soil metagenome]